MSNARFTASEFPAIHKNRELMVSSIFHSSRMRCKNKVHTLWSSQCSTRSLEVCGHQELIICEAPRIGANHPTVSCNLHRIKALRIIGGRFTNTLLRWNARRRLDLPRVWRRRLDLSTSRANSNDEHRYT